MKQVPDFIIIGAMKCMTSTLHEQLASQIGICMSDPKEPCYFSDDEVFAEGPRWYQSLWRQQQPGDLCGESSTHYTKLPTFPQTVTRLAATCPDVKLIYIMRHPIDRLISHYVHEWSMGLVTVPVDQAIKRMSILIDYGRYAYQLKPFLEAFGCSRILPLFYDRLKRYPQGELERVCEFLGYAEHPVWRHEDAFHNVGSRRMRRSGWRDRVAYAPGINWVRRQLVPQSVRDVIKGLWCLKSRPRLRDSTIRHLESVFDKDLLLLSELLDLKVPLTCGNFTEVTATRVINWSLGDALIDHAADACSTSEDAVRDISL